jgi:hypothetical protein
LPAEQSRRDIAFKRARWKAHQDKVDPRRLVFIDETWIKTNMAPLRGWGLRGQRLDARVPHGHWKTLTFIAALRHDRIEAPWVIDGPINGELFATYVEQVLVPALPGMCGCAFAGNFLPLTPHHHSRDTRRQSHRPASQ